VLKSLLWYGIAIATAIVAFAAFTLVPRPPSYPAEIVDEDAIAMTELSELHPDVFTFLDQLRNNQVVGHKTYEFPDLWQHTITDVAEERRNNIVWYQFILPMTPEQQEINKQATSKIGGVPCWPMLGLRVDLDLKVIVKAAVYTQCL